MCVSACVRELMYIPLNTHTHTHKERQRLPGEDVRGCGRPQLIMNCILLEWFSDTAELVSSLQLT